MDLTNMSEALKKGKLIEETNKSTDLVLPIFRIGFPRLDKPGCAKGYEDSKPKYNFVAYYNTVPKTEGCVDLRSVYLKAVIDLDKRAKLKSLDGLEDKVIRVVKSGQSITLLATTATEKNKTDEGEWKPGCGPGIFSSSFAMYPSEKYPDDKPKIVDGKNRILTPADVIPGYWCRAFVQLYVSSRGQVCQGFSTVQVLAKAETFGRPRTAGDLDEVEDADELGTEADRVEDIDDIEF